MTTHNLCSICIVSASLEIFKQLSFSKYCSFIHIMLSWRHQSLNLILFKTRKTNHWESTRANRKGILSIQVDQTKWWGIFPFSRNWTFILHGLLNILDMNITEVKNEGYWMKVLKLEKFPHKTLDLQIYKLPLL